MPTIRSKTAHSAGAAFSEYFPLAQPSLRIYAMVIWMNVIAPVVDRRERHEHFYFGRVACLGEYMDVPRIVRAVPASSLECM